VFWQKLEYIHNNHVKAGLCEYPELSEKGEKFMATHNATIDRKDNSSATLKLALDKEELTIALTEDNPNEVKAVFNKLLVQLKMVKLNLVCRTQKTICISIFVRNTLPNLTQNLKAYTRNLRTTDY
jgi:hypothetical protein